MLLTNTGDLVTCDRKLIVACPNEKGLSLKKTLPVIRKNLTNDINMNNVNWESLAVFS